MECHFKIKGKKVNLRTIVESDISDYERWSDPNLEAWKYDGPWYNNDVSGMAAGKKKRLADAHKPPYRNLEIETNKGIHIGWVNVYCKENDPHMHEIGIDIVESEYWNKGLGTEALKLWMGYLFRERGLTRIGFSTWDANKRMITVGRKLGFIEEGRIRKGCEVNGRFYDRVKMGILKEEWDEFKKRDIRA